MMFEGLPRRALYLCDGADECCNKEGCGTECFRTENIIHAKNGPVVNVRDWDTRFEIKEIDGLLYYWEKEQ